MKHHKTWERHASEISIEDIIRTYHSPAEFHSELASLANEICKQENYKKTIEIGCERGITSMLLNKSLERNFLDFNCEILNKVKQACAKLDIQGNFICEDMFNLSSPDESFDFIFNSGVIEHFNKKERTKLLIEYSRTLHKNGTLLIAFPNHYSFPYRSAYLIKKKLLMGFQWPWPSEYKIRDLREEINAANLELIERKVLAKEMIFGYWKFFSPIYSLLKVTDKLIKYEGYLTILIIKKKNK